MEGAIYPVNGRIVDCREMLLVTFEKNIVRPVKLSLRYKNQRDVETLGDHLKDGCGVGAGFIVASGNLIHLYTWIGAHGTLN
jgi:hypothetical protein